MPVSELPCWACCCPRNPSRALGFWLPELRVFLARFKVLGPIQEVGLRDKARAKPKGHGTVGGIKILI